MVPTSVEEAYRKFDELSAKYIEKLRRYTKLIQDARLARDNEAIKTNLKLYEDELEKYIPVLMAEARIYWERENYPMVEKLFFQSAEFCSDHEVWKLNVAHVFFMQETKFKDAIRYYDPIVKRLSESLLDVTAIVLANLCVGYIMTSQNEEAEELMRRIEKEEERLSFADPEKQCFHLCIVNLGKFAVLWSDIVVAVPFLSRFCVVRSDRHTLLRQGQLRVRHFPHHQGNSISPLPTIHFSILTLTFSLNGVMCVL